MSGVVVNIDQFSGPMALLLHLIRKDEMDIFDINIQEITEQYLATIKSMKKLNLEVAGDFIAMAATLIQIKSKMLLPQYDKNGEVLETEDPRKELVKRLIEYQMYRDAGQNIYAQRSLLGRNVWARGQTENFKVADDSVIMEEENALYALISAYRQAVKNIKRAVHRVAESLQSIADRIWEMRTHLQVGKTARMSELITAKENRVGQVLITFLSLLEMAKIGVVSLFQSENFGDIHIDTKKEITQDAISNVENYDSQINAPSAGLQDIILSEGDMNGEEDELAASQAGLPLFENVMPSKAVLEENAHIEAATDEEIFAEEMKLSFEENLNEQMLSEEILNEEKDPEAQV